MVIILCERLEKYDVVTFGDRKFIYLRDPIEVWTPSGYRKAPHYLSVDKLAEKTLPEQLRIARAMTPRQRILTSGEWHQIDSVLQMTNLEIEDGMVSPPYERTSTIADYVHGRKVKKKSGLAYFDGLLLQNPEIDGEGNFALDEKGIIKAKDVWEMALPLIGNNPTNMPRIFNRFIDATCGMKWAKNQLSPERSYIYLRHDLRMISIVRGNFGWRDLNLARACVIGDWEPLDDAHIAARTVLEELD